MPLQGHPYSADITRRSPAISSATYIRDILVSVLAQELIAGRFKLEIEVASGGMGDVHLGRDLQTGAPVAVKLLQSGPDADAARFSREAALLAQVSHPGIVRYLAHGTTKNGRRYLVMEWIDGETLKDRLRRQALTIVESVEAMRRVAEALSEMHGRGIIHRDIKPSNLMCPGGAVEQIKIVDFGIARRADDRIGLTRTGFMVGSPGYMAPEQARGDRSGLDHRVDLFALGCVLYECLTGRPPFYGDPVSVRAKVLLAQPEPVRHLNPDVSPQLDSLVEQLLSKEPGQRPLNAAELAARLRALHEVPGTRHMPEVAPDPASDVAAAGQEPAVPPTFLLLGESSGGWDASDAEATEENRHSKIAVTAAIEAHDGQWECVDGRWWMVVLPGRGTPSEAVARAAHCALQIRALLPDAPIALLADNSAARLGELIDRAVTTVANESLAAIFPDASGPAPRAAGIRLDEATASLLDDRFQVTRGSDGIYLRDSVQPLPRTNGG